jgi:two-component system sensor histidine kinase VicK
MGSEPSQKVTFPVDKHFINATFTPYYNAAGQIEGVIVVLQDITEQKKLDDMRKEFVANVSHELRTPLTTVKSYTETLMDGAMDDKEIAMEFLGIIDSEADRMALLVRDLLQLSRFDNKQVHLDISDIEMNDFLALTVKQYQIHAEAKRQELTFEPYEKPVFIHADRDRLGQVVNNIVTNAMKYSLEQASIKIYITEDDTYYKISVKDTGMGIAREDLPRIFERFYRVDKARSRAMGGTGLGLAIAKEIMEGHGGRLSAESEYGKGTTMTMWFPKKSPEQCYTEV